jgi:hypothetical protein
MVFHDAKAVIAPLLTCPHLAKDETMLFHEDDPFDKPPACIKELSDINSAIWNRTRFLCPGRKENLKELVA